MRRFTLFLSVFLSVLNSYSQDQPTFEKKVIKDQNGKIYWQLQLPIYLQASTSPDGTNAVKMDLVKTENMQKHANPMIFDGHGVHYIRHIDYDNAAHEQDIAFEINVDGIAPKTSLTLGGAPAYNNGKWFFGKNLSGVLKATDEMSGVENMHQSINGSAYSINNGTIAFQEEKEYSINYFSVDRVGNTEKAQTKNFVVDLTPPVTNYDVSVDHIDGKIISPRTVISLKSSDNLSGVKKVEYHFDETSSVTYSGRAWQNNLEDGDHVLYFTSVDQVSNAEDTKQYAFYLDKKAPVVTSAFNANYFIKGGKTYVAKATTIELKATDNKAGVKNISYVINGVNETEYTNAFNLPQKQGAYSVKFRAMDNVNNRGTLGTNDELASIFLDDTPPALSHIISTPKIFTRDTLFITKDSNIQLKSIDLESGSASIEYAIDNGTNAKYENALQVSSEGIHTVAYTGYDHVNNSSSKNFLFIVDNSGPEVFFHMSLEKIGSQKLADSSKEIPVYPSGTSLYLAGTDNLVGTKAIYFSIDKSPEGIYAAPVKLLTKGKHSITLKAVDYLGNQTTLEPIEFVIQ